MNGTSQSSRNTLKVSDGDQNMASIDRLSSLPDAIICHILSFLPTKLSVSTSILARKWRFRWAHVLNLEFDSEDYRSETSFSSIINRVMLLRKARSINTFRLYCYESDCSRYELETWISAAIERNVQNIDLNLHPETIADIYAVPRCLFTCRTLVDLRLCLCTFPPFSGAISLPSLKNLYLDNVEYVVDEALPHLLSCCPVLDELTIVGFVVDNCYNISSHTIRRLTVEFQNNCQSFSRDYKVKINAPALKYLELTDQVATHISAHMLTSLIEADISFHCFTHDGDDYYFLSVLRFVDCLCKVKCLKLTIGLVFSCEIKSIIRFDNCTWLELAADWFFLMKFLESADNLEVVIIRESFAYLKNWVEPKQVPACLLSHLGTVRIDGFDCEETEFNMIRYFLMNAKVLKRMEIHFKCNGIDLKEKIEARQRIALLKRGSEACELAFY